MLAQVLAAAAAAALAAAQEHGPESDPLPPARDAVKVEAAAHGRPGSWFLLPVVFWLPETKLGLGLATGRDLRLAGAERPSNALLVAGYALEGQRSLDGSTDVWLPGGTLLAARVRAVHYPDAFYGIGPTTATSSREDYVRRFVEASAGADRPVVRALRVGLRLAARAEELREVVPGGRLETSGLPGVGGFTALGAGGSVTWDSRDHPLRTLRGTFAQAYYVRYPGGVARTEGFGKGALDLREFVPLGPGRVLALGGVVETTDGATPFSLLSKLGNARFFRGIREGRYRDRLAWAAQAELRVPVPVGTRLSATAFAAAGDVAPEVSALTVRHLKAAGGIGARWRLTDEGVNLRADVAVGREGTAAYVVLLEAF